MDIFAACPEPGCAEAVGSSPLRSEYSEVEMRDSATLRSGVKNAQPEAEQSFKQGQASLQAFLASQSLSHRAAALEEFGIESLRDYVDSSIVTTKTLVGVFGFTEAEVAVYHQSLPEARRAMQQATI